jgi:hypothetical protein
MFDDYKKSMAELKRKEEMNYDWTIVCVYDKAKDYFNVHYLGRKKEGKQLYDILVSSAKRSGLNEKAIMFFEYPDFTEEQWHDWRVDPYKMKFWVKEKV